MGVLRSIQWDHKMFERLNDSLQFLEVVSSNNVLSIIHHAHAMQVPNTVTKWNYSQWKHSALKLKPMTTSRAHINRNVSQIVTMQLNETSRTMQKWRVMCEAKTTINANDKHPMTIIRCVNSQIFLAIKFPTRFVSNAHNPYASQGLPVWHSDRIAWFICNTKQTFIIYIKCKACNSIRIQ